MLTKMKVLAAALALGFSALPASAAPVVFAFTHEFSEAQNCANVATTNGCATLSVDTNGTGGVTFTLIGNLAAGEFISGLYGNQDPFNFDAASSPSSFSVFTGTGSNAVAGTSTGEDDFKADGDGFFDWMIDLSTSPPRFDGSDTLTWSISNTSLASIVDAVSQNGSAGKNGFSFAIHVQGIANGGSGWFSTTTQDGGGGGGGQVPEPATILLFGAGLAGLGLMRRRRVV